MPHYFLFLFILMYYCLFSMKLAMLPITLYNNSILHKKFSIPMLIIFVIIAFIRFSIRPGHNSISLHFSSLPLPIKSPAVGPFIYSFTLYIIEEKFALIWRSIDPLYLAPSLSFSSMKLTFINASVF